MERFTYTGPLSAPKRRRVCGVEASEESPSVRATVATAAADSAPAATAAADSAPAATVALGSATAATGIADSATASSTAATAPADSTSATAADAAEFPSLYQDRFRSICAACFARRRRCYHHAETQLRLLIIGHNPSSTAYATGQCLAPCAARGRRCCLCLLVVLCRLLLLEPHEPHVALLEGSQVHPVDVAHEQADGHALVRRCRIRRRGHGSWQ
jgi:hypothetical protein